MRIQLSSVKMNFEETCKKQCHATFTCFENYGWLTGNEFKLYLNELYFKMF